MLRQNRNEVRMRLRPLRRAGDRATRDQTETGKTRKTIRPQQPLGHVASVLTGVVGSILQVSDRKARVALGAGAKVAASATAAGTVTGLVGSFGAASTGTAIASLYGAAKTSATLAWIGGLVGGGVAAGSAVLVVGGAGAGLYAAHKMRGAVFGAAREYDQVSATEERILAAVAALKSTIDATAQEGRDISPSEMRLFAVFGLAPLVEEIDSALRQGAFSDLRRYYRIRLRGQAHTLRRLQTRMEELT